MMLGPLHAIWIPENTAHEEHLFDNGESGDPLPEDKVSPQHQPPPAKPRWYVWLLVVMVVLCWGGGAAIYSVACKFGSNSAVWTWSGLSFGMGAGYIGLALLTIVPKEGRGTIWAEVVAEARAAAKLPSSANPRWIRITAVLYSLIVPSTVLAYIVIDYLIAKAGKSIAVVNVVTVVCCLLPTVLFGMVGMGESMTVGKAVGLAAILVGSILLGFGGGGGGNGDGGDGDVAEVDGHLDELLIATSGSGWLSAEDISSSGNYIPISVGKEMALMATIVLFFGTPTVLFTYGPKVITSAASASLLWAASGLLSAAVSTTAGLLVRGTAFDLTQTLLVALAGALAAFGGNGCYTALSRSGMDGTTLAPIVMLYPIVPIFVDVALGELLSVLTSVGLALILGAILVLSREIG